MSDSPSQTAPLASVVVPIYNEECSIEALLQRLAVVVSTLPGYQWELVLVDDGSSDRTVELVQKHRPLFPGIVRLVEFSRNFGQQPALLAGLQESRGQFVILIDADLQDPPEMFSRFIQKFQEGYEVVYAVRKSRKEIWLKRWAYSLFYRLLDWMAETNIPLDSGDFGLISRRVADFMVQHPDKDLFLRALRNWAGFRQIGVEYDRPERAAGETKYTLRKLFKLAGSGIFGYSTLPLRFSTMLGLISVVMCIGYGIYAIVGKLVYANNPPGWTSLMVIMLFLGGVQLISVGLLGEYIGRIYRQVQPRPHFIIKESKTL